MRSAKGFWLATAAVSCIVVGIFLASGAVVALSLPIVAYIGMMALLLESGEAKLEVKRSVSDTRIMAGDIIEVEITVRNLGPKIDLIEVKDRIPDHLVVKKGNNVALMSLDPGEEQSFSYTLGCPLRGRYVLDNMAITVMDTGRLHAARLDFRNKSEFSVVATVEPIRGVKIAPKKTRNWVGMIKSKRVGIGTEFYGLRDYVSGDELRKINWKASARSEGLLTNEFESECSGDATLILDARLEANVGLIESCSVEHGVRATSTIASQILKDKNRVGLIVLRDIIDEVYPAFGKRQFYKLSEHLLDVKPLGLLPFENVGWMVTGYFPLESQIIIISSLTDRDIITTIGDLCARGYDVVVISPSPIKLESCLVDDTPERTMASRILELERDNLISELSKYARIVDWDPDDPLANALRGVSASLNRR
ncbi:MAG: DUF58 domain-containing protein [Candidatus Thermoplasmatota archaeon]|nr:DUF58 domain-containing protein [Euryarchaeota archaeon]MBU4031758.1 DUF58 domain-containing protein [Candidatus Thermoplasmatota archaeon]MBU4072115.1 DUF58 domain-containing protein [Candidatus Thermoplasmatota archaeon]MBU4144992.1 DUF58 domain-containing protein [Candidatus Thermoplasmatota archaeon]MBU4592006.1 DUF58 domain-containing protein [Candidatus Thermoplasmatota archaeon]